MCVHVLLTKVLCVHVCARARACVCVCMCACKRYRFRSMAHETNRLNHAPHPHQCSIHEDPSPIRQDNQQLVRAPASSVHRLSLTFSKQCNRVPQELSGNRSVKVEIGVRMGMGMGSGEEDKREGNEMQFVCK